MSWRTDPVTLFLDYDGTLHDCLRIYAPAFRTVWRELEGDGLQPPRHISDERITGWLGLSVQEMWDDFMPQLSREQQTRYGSRIGEEMFRLVQAGQATFYPGAEDSLDALRSAGYRLVFLSNCPHDYMEAHRKHFGLDRWFDEQGWRDLGRELGGEGPGPYTWWSWRGQAFVNDAGWRIDYQLATPGLADLARTAEVDRAATYEERFSDHAPVVVAYDI